MADSFQFRFPKWLAIASIPLGIAATVVVVVAQRLFRLKTTVDLTCSDVVTYLENFLNGEGGDWDWDDFTSVPITDPKLDEIRAEASSVPLPLDHTGRAVLEALVVRARANQSTYASP